MRHAATSDQRPSMTLAGLLVGAGLSLLGCELNVIEATPIEDEDSGSEGGSDDVADTGESGTTTTTTGTGESSTDTGDGLASFRVVVIADPHVVGPNYQGGDPNLLGAADQLIAVREAVAAIDPPPDFGVVLGDLVHDAYASLEPSWYEQNPNAFATVDDILAGFPFPVYPAFGESDYGLPDAPKTLSHTLFATYFAQSPNYSREYQGWRFVFANSQLGPAFDGSTGAYGAQQLTWLGGELDDPIPTVLFTHIPVYSSLADEAPNNGAYPDIDAVVANSSGLKLILAGHSHTWNSMPNAFVAPHITFGATRYDTDNFLLIEFFEDGSYEILDLLKVEWGTPNADTWTYDGTPKPG